MEADTGASLMWLSLPLAALAAGFLGSLHCIGMCGGVSGTIALAAKSPVRDFADGRSSMANSSAYAITTIHRTPARTQTRAAAAIGANVLAFNSGRIASYALAGAIAGGAGGLLGQTWIVGESFNARAMLFLFANLMIVLTGLYVMGLPQLLAPLERVGGKFWRYVAPVTKRFLPMDTLPRAAMFGALWGWIPCGLVYAMLLTAIGSGGVASGALTMLAFGLGTLPAMLFAGLAMGNVARWTREIRLRQAAGAVIVALGLVGFARYDALTSLQAFGALCLSMLPAS